MIRQRKRDSIELRIYRILMKSGKLLQSTSPQYLKLQTFVHERYLGATHLVHTYARGVMPCYDEPSLTATFKLAITHHESYQAVSNTAGDRKSK